MNNEAAIDGTTLKVTALLNRFWNPGSSILHPSWPEILQEYPAHIHIDILPGYQGQNLGRRLMAELIRKLESEKVKGIHLMKSEDTVGTEKFYEKVEFGRWPFKMGGEVRDREAGVKPGGGVCMLREVGK